MPAQILPFETREARTARLNTPKTEATVKPPTAAEAIDGDAPMFPNMSKMLPDDNPGAITPVNRTNIAECSALIKDRARGMLHNMISGYEMAYGHAPSQPAQDMFMTLADLVALVDCKELINADHPYTEAFQAFLARTK